MVLVSQYQSQSVPKSFLFSSNDTHLNIGNFAIKLCNETDLSAGEIVSICVKKSCDVRVRGPLLRFDRFFDQKCHPVPTEALGTG